MSIVYDATNDLSLCHVTLSRRRVSPVLAEAVAARSRRGSAPLMRVPYLPLGDGHQLGSLVCGGRGNAVRYEQSGRRLVPTRISSLYASVIAICAKVTLTDTLENMEFGPRCSIVKSLPLSSR